MRKWIGLGLLVLMALAGCWYFLIKEHDYKISFQTTAAPGSIYVRALHWKPERTKTLDGIPYRELSQELRINGRPVHLTWEFNSINDSVTRVEAVIKATENIFLERLKLLVGQSAQQKKMAEELKTFRDLLEKDAELFDIQVMGESIMPESLCACVPLENQMEQKASGMMQNIGLLQEYMRQNGLQLEGKPRVEVTEWDHSTDRISFDFCFPVPSEKELPTHPLIKIKKIPSDKALKANFRGNYIFSHHAWLQLLNYAQIHDFEVAGEPLEIFIDNPEMGGNSRDWQAEVYLPIR